MAYDDAIEQRLQRLRTKLLDLTTTNRMLSYRHPRASCLRVVDELPVEKALREATRLSITARASAAKRHCRTKIGSCGGSEFGDYSWS